MKFSPLTAARQILAEVDGDSRTSEEEGRGFHVKRFKYVSGREQHGSCWTLKPG